MIFVILLGGALQATAGELIQFDSSGYLNTQDLIESEFYAENQDAILSEAKAKVDAAEFLADDAKDALKKSIDELPFHRVIDIELAAFSGFPDTFALCLEGHPVGGLAIEACAGYTVFVASLSANVKYRWDLVLKETDKGNFHQLSLGPGAGIRKFEACLFGCADGWMAEAMASLEYVFWVARHFGITAQLDLGATYFLGYEEADETSILPYGKLTIGVAF